MTQDTTTRRNALKTIGAAAAATSLPVGSAAAATLDDPYIFISQHVYDTYSRYDVMSPISGLLLDALPDSVADAGWARTDYPDVSSASSLEDAHSQFKSFLNRSGIPKSNATNILVLDETRFTGNYEADGFGGPATTVTGAKAIEEYHKQNGDPDRYGYDEPYESLWHLLTGVGLNYDSTWGEGVTYQTPSDIDPQKYDWVRTPMVAFSDAEEYQTNHCGDQTYRTMQWATKDLRYADCALSSIKQYSP